MHRVHISQTWHARECWKQGVTSAGSPGTCIVDGNKLWQNASELSMATMLNCWIDSSEKWWNIMTYVVICQITSSLFWHILLWANYRHSEHIPIYSKNDAIPTPGQLESKKRLCPPTCFHETKGAGSWLVGLLKLGCSIKHWKFGICDTESDTNMSNMLVRSRLWSRLIWAYEGSK